MRNKDLTCYTIGHSNYSITSFIQILKNYKIDCLIDVRSTPYSKYSSQFNREVLNDALKKENIAYIFMGNLLGGRYTDSKLLFSDGQVNFKNVRKTTNFNLGIKRILAGIEKDYSVVLMCSEKDPINCHRFVLISYELEKKGVLVNHILDINNIISNQTEEKILINKYYNNLQQNTLFESPLTRQELLENIYEKRNKEIAYIYRPLEKAI